MMMLENCLDLPIFFFYRVIIILTTVYQHDGIGTKLLLSLALDITQIALDVTQIALDRTQIAQDITQIALDRTQTDITGQCYKQFVRSRQTIR